MTCDDEESLEYFRGCLSAAKAWTYEDRNSANWFNECAVVLRFQNGTEYRSSEPCKITAEGLGFSLPGQERAEHNLGSTYVAFRDPMPDGWKNLLKTLLGPAAVK